MFDFWRNPREVQKFGEGRMQNGHLLLSVLGLEFVGGQELVDQNGHFIDLNWPKLGQNSALNKNFTDVCV